MILYILALGSPTHPLPDEAWRAYTARPRAARVPRPDARGLRAAVRPPVLARLDRLPRHPRRLDGGEGARLLRELAPGDAGAARVRDREPAAAGGLRAGRLGPHRLRRPRREGDGRRPRGRVLGLRRARRGLRRGARRRDDRAHRRASRRCPSRPRSSCPRSWRCAAATARTCTASTASSTRSTRRCPTAPRCGQGRVVPGAGWFDTDYLGIDQGPILAMIENHRSGFVWRVMRRTRTCSAGCCAPASGADGSRRCG